MLRFGVQMQKAHGPFETKHLAFKAVTRGRRRWSGGACLRVSQGANLSEITAVRGDVMLATLDEGRPPLHTRCRSESQL